MSICDIYDRHLRNKSYATVKICSIFFSFVFFLKIQLHGGHIDASEYFWKISIKQNKKQ